MFPGGKEGPALVSRVTYGPGDSSLVVFAWVPSLGHRKKTNASFLLLFLLMSLPTQIFLFVFYC